MNSSSQAQKGFKTFIITLVISLAVFSAIYYVVNAGAGSSSSFDEVSSQSESQVTTPKSDSVQSSTLGNTSARGDIKVAEEKNGDVAGAKVENKVDTRSEEDTSVFKELATTEMHVAQRQVLAETGNTVTTTNAASSGQTAESTVPDTGLLSPTYGLILSLVLLSLAAYVIFIGPRKLALSHFEKDLLDDLD